MKRFRTRILSALTAVTMLTGGMTGLSASAEFGDPGDVDSNGKVEIADAILLARYLAEDRDPSVRRNFNVIFSDVNRDDSIDAYDLADLLCMLAGSYQTFSPAAGRSADLLADAYPDETMTALSPASDDFRAAQSAFSAGLLRTLTEQAEDKYENILVSPVSVSLALGMTMNGAKGETLDQMLDVLGGGMDADRLNGFNAGWSKQLLEKRSVCRYTYDDKYGYREIREEYTPVTLANALWIKDCEDEIRVPESFLQRVFNYYQAGAFKAPFDQTTVEDVNSWCCEKTHHMIPKAIDEIAPDTAMLLANALTFEDEWKDQYIEGYFTGTKFHAANGEIRDAEMMRCTEGRYICDGKAQGFIKSYRDDRCSFAAVLPNEGTTLDEYIAGLDGAGLQALLDSVQSCEVITEMPKFRFDYSADLTPALEALGMEKAFAPDADFTGMNEAGTPLYIGQVIHKTSITLDEKGTRAAAVTVVQMPMSAMPDEEPKKVILDHPFLFMILDNSTQLPIFMGTVKDIPAE